MAYILQNRKQITTDWSQRRSVPDTISEDDDVRDIGLCIHARHVRGDVRGEDLEYEGGTSRVRVRDGMHAGSEGWRLDPLARVRWEAKWN